MGETYILKVAPTYTVATHFRGNAVTTLEEWSGCEPAKFIEGMKGRGFAYHVEEYELSSGKFVEHVFTR